MNNFDPLHLLLLGVEVLVCPFVKVVNEINRVAVEVRYQVRALLFGVVAHDVIDYLFLLLALTMALSWLLRTIDSLLKTRIVFVVLCVGLLLNLTFNPSVLNNRSRRSLVRLRMKILFPQDVVCFWRPLWLLATVIEIGFRWLSRSCDFSVIRRNECSRFWLFLV